MGISGKETYEALVNPANAPKPGEGIAKTFGAISKPVAYSVAIYWKNNPASFSATITSSISTAVKLKSSFLILDTFII